ncbi:MAG: trypsin-like serine protease [Actinomycetota bacterium]
MRRLALLVAATAALALIPGSAQGIVYGEFDGNRHRNVGGFVVQRPNGTYRTICSGTLIDADTFLTAAHCTAALESLEIELDDVWVSFDPTFDQRSPRIPGVADLNEAYNQSQDDPNDVAVIELDRPVTNITPARLPRAGLLSDLSRAELRSRTFTAVGYGTIRETRKTGPQGILDTEERRYALQSATTLTQAWLKLSMNEATGDGGTCYGDSGGPHFIGGKFSNWIVSLTVTGDAVCKASDVTYRLDTQSARDYLEEFVTLP